MKNYYDVIAVIILAIIVSVTCHYARAESIDTTIKTLQVTPTITPLIIKVPEEFSEDNEAVWNDIEDTIVNGPDKVIDIEVQGYGGDVHMVNKFMRTIEDAKKAGKTIIMDVIGPAYSAHAYMTCNASQVNIRNGAGLMFHEMASYPSVGAMGLITWRSTSIDPNLQALEVFMLAQCQQQYHLSDNDVRNILEGNDVYYTRIGAQYYITCTQDQGAGLFTIIHAASLIFYVLTWLALVFVVRLVWSLAA